MILFTWLANSNKVFKQSPYYFENFALKEISCLQTENLFCPMESRKDASQILLYIRDNTQWTDRFLAIPKYRLAEQIRYGGLRTSSLSIGDSARLAYSNTDISHLPAQYEEYAALVNDDKAIELEGFVTFACKLSADYLLIDHTIPVEIIRGNNRVNLEMQNNTYKVVKITTCL